MTAEDDLRTQLDELERTLDALREELDGDRPGRPRRRRPRPPSPLELLRFTESHTLPTLVATLEATIEALELVRGLLRLADPAATDDRARELPPGARATVGRALSDLRSALEGADLPDDPAARELVTDARDLAADVEARLDDARRGAGEPSSDAGVDVREAGEDGGSTADVADSTSSSDVDVTSELDSIRDEIRGDDADE
ncbi:hypothetical protein ACFQJD_05775 [Haloplanus sp. GCM10025708]|uniref:DUF7547 family protein n=1 Tax=Haloferacaceae TaxID=1644056 RepID=UPI00360607AF